MDNISEIVPFLIIIGSIIFSIVKGVSKKAKEETAKTTLPGKFAKEKRIEIGREVAPVPTQRTQKGKTVISEPKQGKKQGKANIPIHQVKTENSLAPLPETEDDEPISFLNISDMDEVKKAIIYSEIFSRK